MPHRVDDVGQLVHLGPEGDGPGVLGKVGIQLFSLDELHKHYVVELALLRTKVLRNEGTGASPHLGHNLFLMLHLVPLLLELSRLELLDCDQLLSFLAVVINRVEISRTDVGNSSPGCVDIGEAALVDMFVAPQHLLYL